MDSLFYYLRFLICIKKRIKVIITYKWLLIISLLK